MHTSEDMGRRRPRHEPREARAALLTKGAPMSAGTDQSNLSELSSRSANGLDVALLWRRFDNTAIVVVVDHDAGAAFQLDVRENDNALDIFHHPYAYAAHRGIDSLWSAHSEVLRSAA
jgi:hypothetical protein